ncbi:hypothetical protein [Thiocapsa rosea]|uniref:Uncharacterized protein n=1 Tax=Thiocapsa rosea TaxID=69360 RepID=A0A495V230_9GAMM|nr:hypothetical protein [Thiocapsa rosea]RKT43394.1 hypothetical protein BDD21_0727 [Thiocapsa rosea]
MIRVNRAGRYDIVFPTAAVANILVSLAESRARIKALKESP